MWHLVEEIAGELILGFSYHQRQPLTKQRHCCAIKSPTKVDRMGKDGAASSGGISTSET